MTGLLRAEVRRLLSRRLFKVLGLVFLGLFLLVQVVNAARSHGPTAYDQTQIDRQTANCAAARAAADSDAIDFECGDGMRGFDPRYRADLNLPEVAGAIAVASTLMSFIVGASFAGAEWAAGTMQALLFWEPRRGRVVAAKAAALAGVMVAFTLAMGAVGFGTTMLVAATRGTTEGVTGDVVRAALFTSLRGAILVAFTGVLGFAVAGLARVTGAALGAAFVYFAIVEQVIGGKWPGWIRYLVAPNIAAVLTNHLEVPARAARDSDTVDPTIVLHAGRGTLTLAVYLALVLGAFWAMFSRRDVT